ncbi:MAG: hypothetical protein JWM03_1337 [Rhodocyclales bacterium]|nr:hypothetical protein [Rhodocyclales bacterium]MDB5888465.1 hypothetical protein [Rhodocyclales bacterium]
MKNVLRAAVTNAAKVSVKTLPGIVTMAGLMLLASAAQANEFAPVIAKSEILKDVVVPHQVCRSDTVEVQPQRSGAGAVIGGIAGGVLGHTVGQGGGKTAATVVGAITGAVVGDRVDNRDNAPEARQVERCHTVQDHQDQLVGYRVTYEYAGKRYTTRMARDPGDRVELQINVVGGEYEQPATYRDDRPYRRNDR